MSEVFEEVSPEEKGNDSSLVCLFVPPLLGTRDRSKVPKSNLTRGN